MVKPLTFKGDPKKKKRKQRSDDPERARKQARRNDGGGGGDSALTTTSTTTSTTTTTTGPAATAEGGEGVRDRDHEEDTSWVSADKPGDIRGPVMLVFPSSPPTCIACDANGSVFAMEVENLIEGSPGTAEPHDVRQVWVASKIIGGEGIHLKGHHGKYLSCDKNGILDAAASAVSPYEVFLPIPSQSRDSTFALQIASGDIERFLSFAEPPESDAGPPSSSSSSRRKIRLRGDADSLSFQTTTHVRMQARFKPAPPVSRERSAAVLGWTSRLELETAAGRKLDDEEVKVLRKARKEGNYHEALLDVRVKSKHDKFAS